MTTKNIWSYFMSVERTWTSHCEGQSLAKLACFCANWLVTSFLAIVATAATYKYNIIGYVSGVKIFPENNAISCIICVELQDLHTPSVILH